MRPAFRGSLTYNLDNLYHSFLKRGLPTLPKETAEQSLDITCCNKSPQHIVLVTFQTIIQCSNGISFHDIFPAATYGN